MDSDLLLKEFYLALLHFILMVYFFASSDVVINIKNSLENIRASSTNLGANHDEIRCLEWQVRDHIETTNEVFSWTWGLHCMVTFNTGVFVVNEVIGGRLSVLEKIFTLMGDIFNLIRFHQVAEVAHR